MTNIFAFDQGSYTESDGVLSVDVEQNVCDVEDNGDEVLESFYETILGVQVQSDLFYNTRFKRVRYRVPNVGGKARVRSKRLGFLQTGTVPGNGETTLLLVPFLRIVGRTKVFAGQSAAIDPALGFRNVTVRLRGKDAMGKTVVIRGRTALSFGDWTGANKLHTGPLFDSGKASTILMLLSYLGEDRTRAGLLFGVRIGVRLVYH